MPGVEASHSEGFEVFGVAGGNGHSGRLSYSPDEGIIQWRVLGNAESGENARGWQIKGQYAVGKGRQYTFLEPAAQNLAPSYVGSLFGHHAAFDLRDGDVASADCDGALDREEDAEQTCTYETNDGEEYETLAIYQGVIDGDDGAKPHMGFTWHEEAEIDLDDPELEEHGPSSFPVPDE